MRPSWHLGITPAIGSPSACCGERVVYCTMVPREIADEHTHTS